MNSPNFDVVVVGAGAAGLSAAVGLARAGFAVAVVEAAAFPGAENWSGCVYFCENLAHPDLLGPAGVEALAWERRLVERGFFMTDGQGLLGMTYRDPEAFRHCYTVLRPIYDHHLAQFALRQGVALLTSTTAESLIRDGDRVVGVCTNRGPIYANLVFLAEGDASHLVTREGYERSRDERDTPKFLQGIKQVIEMPAGAIEEIFHVGPEEGVAYEMLLRNGSLRGRSLHLNMGGFVYTNRQSLSIGLVLPADNLKEHFAGDPNLLMEWFETLPALEPWLRGGRRGTFGAKIIRGGGVRDIPNLIDHGLAIGGAASAIGIDFPYPNFTGPATAMGLLLTQAACRIRTEGGRFSREDLNRHYLEPLQRTNYWLDVEFLRRWPGYVKRSSVFFGSNLDLALGTAYVWTRPDRSFFTKWVNWVRLLLTAAGPTRWRELRSDLHQLSRAVRFRDVMDRPRASRLFLDGTINALRDLCGRPRAKVPPAGIIRLQYSVAGGPAPAGRPPTLACNWFHRLAPVLASAARRVYANNEVPLAVKLNGALRLLSRQINLLDLVVVAIIGFAVGVSSGLLVCWERMMGLVRRGRGLVFRPRARAAARGLYPRYALAMQRATDLTLAAGAAAQQWEARLGKLAYQTVKASHIHVLWPRAIADKNKVTADGLWHVCPAHVYEARVSPLGQLQLVVNFENCIKCETCWRTSNLADWGRDGQHRFIYPVATPAVTPLLEALHTTGFSRPREPLALDGWEEVERKLAAVLRVEAASTPQQRPERDGMPSGRGAEELAEVAQLLTKLEQKLDAFDTTLAEEPRTIDRAWAEYLEMLARYAQQLAIRLLEALRGSDLANGPSTGMAAIHEQLLRIATALAAKAEERSRRTWNQHFAWAAADGRQMRFHHIAGLRRILSLLPKQAVMPAEEIDPSPRWLRAEQDQARVATQLLGWRARLDAAFAPTAWRDLESQKPLTPEQDATLRDLIAQVPPLDLADLPGTIHPPLRKALLAELGRRDPSLAFRAASHLWARDLASVGAVSASLSRTSQRWRRGDEWACFAIADAVPVARDGWKGEALFVPARAAGAALLLLGDHLAVVPLHNPGAVPGLTIEPLPTLGLRGAGLARLVLDGWSLPEVQATVDRDRIARIWQAVSAADLISIAHGMADQLCQRAIGHATTRVQFPGLFHDEEARDTIGKFGAVKKMIAEMGARRYLLETLDHVLSPADFSASSVERAGLLKAVVAEALGTAPGSLTYNAGQVFGGTGYSEDDILSKFYRDAASWRFLGPINGEVYRHHGSEVLHSGRADGHRLLDLPDEALLFEQVAQRKALQAELDGLRVARSRLRGLAGEWQTARKAAASLDSETGAGSDIAVPSFQELAGDPDCAAGHGSAAVPGAEIAEALARQDAHLLASKALLLRTHARLENGLPAETETALLRVWLEEASGALQRFDTEVRRALEPEERLEDRPLVEPSAGPPITAYADFLAAPCPYDSGDFLTRPIDLRQPRLVPEMVLTDPELKSGDQAYRDLLSGYFGRSRENGLSYERWIEQHHRPSAEDLDFCRQHGFFRMPIAPDLGGEGRRKIDYYLLVSNAQRLADVAVSLTIQVNSSIGTTPILLARDKDLPRAVRELATFRDDTTLQATLSREFEALYAALEEPEPQNIESAYQALSQRLQVSVFSRSALRVMTHRFGEAWQAAGQARQSFDLARTRSCLGEALAEWKESLNRAEEWQAELARRREACDLFLRWIASGQISGFALTEPSAGSDTARVATRAQLRSVPVEVEADGVLRFVPAGSHEPRFLLDASRLVFRTVERSSEVNRQAHEQEPCYHWSDNAEPAPIRFDDYDYETDDAERMRYYDHGGRRVQFTDIAQLRSRDCRLWYDYWELTGAKMWITNARMAGVFCLYAKTSEGVTGFMVDRHAEGLIVGKDEAKMGQCGSPTNELSLQAVRVPRENVLGLEGRGQVNALETLNVGRAGLSVSGMAQMAGVIERCCDFARARSDSGDIPDWAACRLQSMEEERFISEALAYEMIGRFDQPQTKSVRLESAIAKMLVSEMLHHLIETAEEIHGLAGQTQHHLVEKRKRDARILNIYEGTNAIQRFLILKDLASEIVSQDGGSAADSPRHLSSPVLDLEALKASFRQRLGSAREMLGQDLWQNPNLQANCFLLAEAAAWIKAGDSTLGRLAWLGRHELGACEPGPVDSATGTVPVAGLDGSRSGEMIHALSGLSGSGTGLRGGGHLLAGQFQAASEVGRRALARCMREVRDRLRRFDEALVQLRRGHYGTEIRAATLLLDHPPMPDPPPEPASRITRPLSILVVVEPVAVSAPEPQVEGGQLLEPHRTLPEADRAALETALRIRDQAGAPVTIELIAVGPAGAAQVLREALSLGVDRARLLVAEALTPGCAASALATLLRAGKGSAQFDLILGGDSNDQDGLVAHLTAVNLGLPFAGRAGRLALRATDNEAELLLWGGSLRAQPGGSLARALPAAVAIEAGIRLRSFTIGGYLTSLARIVEPERLPRRVVALPGEFAVTSRPEPVASVEEAPGPLSPDQAALRLLRDLGRGRDGATRAPHAYEGSIVDVVQPKGLKDCVLAVLAADRESRLATTAVAVLQAARLIAQSEEAAVVVLLLASQEEQAQRRALAQLAESYRGTVVLLGVGETDLSVEILGRVLAECWPGLDAAPRAAIGESWAESAFGSLAVRAGQSNLLHLRVRRLAWEQDQVILETGRADGKLRLRHGWSSAVPVARWLTLAAEADVAGPSATRSDIPLTVERWTPQLDRFYSQREIQRLLAELKQEIGVPRLTDAEFILDVGFGVGNRDGYEAVIEPLEQVLRDLGVQTLVIGGSRKVTEELHLLPADRQIGQSGTSVNPRILLAIGVSGAPQHLNYIGPRATILAFNRDPEAPLMTLNRRQSRPRVLPILGDLFETVPAFIQALQREEPAGPEKSTEAVRDDGTLFAPTSRGADVE